LKLRFATMPDTRWPCAHFLSARHPITCGVSEHEDRKHEHTHTHTHTETHTEQKSMKVLKNIIFGMLTPRHIPAASDWFFLRLGQLWFTPFLHQHQKRW